MAGAAMLPSPSSSRTAASWAPCRGSCRAFEAVPKGQLPREGRRSLTAQALGDVGALGPETALLPALGAAAGLLVLKLTAYSQREVVTAGMLGRHVKPGGARVLQLGGSTRDLFYYPAGTVQVTAAGPDVSVGLWEQAGLQAKVPVRAVKAPVAGGDLSFAAGSSVDSVVAIDALAGVTDVRAFAREVRRVLKPGGTCVWIQRTEGSGLAALARLLSGGGVPVGAATLDALTDDGGWDFVQWDVALQGLDPLAVGVAIKPLQAGGSESVGKEAFEQVLKSKARRAGGGGQPDKGFRK